MLNFNVTLERARAKYFCETQTSSDAFSFRVHAMNRTENYEFESRSNIAINARISIWICCLCEVAIQFNIAPNMETAMNHVFNL